MTASPLHAPRHRDALRGSSRDVRRETCQQRNPAQLLRARRICAAGAQPARFLGLAAQDRRARHGLARHSTRGFCVFLGCCVPALVLRAT
jgi:hypothetical protein